MITPTQARTPNAKLSFWRDTRGLSTVEYVIILVLIAAAAVSAWSLLGQTVRGKIKASIGQMHQVKIEKE